MSDSNLNSTTSTTVKRPRSDSVESKPDNKRPYLDSSVNSNSNGNYNDTWTGGEDIKMEDHTVNTGSAPSTSTLQPAPASAGLPETPVAAAQAASQQDEATKPTPIMTIRALIVTQDAAVIIGKGGASLREIREKAGARVAVSEAIEGNPERILIVSGPLDAISKAYGLIVRRINDEPFDQPSVPGSKAVTVRFIIPDARMGLVIGRAGAKIREIQEASGARLQAGQQMLPGSTERILTVSGVADAIHIAVYYVGTILQEASERPLDNRPYKPGQPSRDPYGGSGRDTHGSSRDPYGSRGGRDDRRDDRYGGPPSRGGPPPRGENRDRFPNSTATVPGAQTQQIFIPDDLVAAIIGKAGSKINEIREKSAAYVKVMQPYDEQQKKSGAQPGERLVTITGLPENIQMAIQMLYSRLEEEKQRKLSLGE